MLPSLLVSLESYADMTLETHMTSKAPNLTSVI